MTPSGDRVKPFDRLRVKRVLVVGRGSLGAAILESSWIRRYKPEVAARTSGMGHRLDITDEAGVRVLFARNHWDLVINCAAMTDVDGCERDPEAAYAANALGVRYLAEACDRTGAALLHVSTNYVFPGTGRSPLNEDDPAGPCSVYGTTKLAGEHYALASRRSAVVRTSWIFGGRKRDFVNHFIEKLKSRGTVPVVADQRASLMYAPDLAEAMGPIAGRLLEGRRPARRVYHIANAGGCTRHEMLLEMRRLLKSRNPGKKGQQGNFAAWAAVRPKYTVFSCKRYKAEFGRGLRHWKVALKEYLGV